MLLSEGFLPFSRGSSTQNHQSQSLAAEICLFGLWYGGSEVKASACNAGDPGLIPGVGRSIGEGNGNPLHFLPGESHGRRSLVGYSPRCRKESDMTERLHFH